MLYTPTKDQQLMRGHPTTVEIPEGYTVLKVGDILPAGSKVYMGDIDKVTPWYPLAEKSFGNPVRSPVGIYIAPLPKMDKWDILLVRACKTGKNARRFRRILQKRAGFSGHIPCSYIAERLWAIVQKYDPPNSIIDLLNDFSPEMAWRFNAGAKEESDYWTRVVNVLSSRIAIMEGVKLTGYIPHAAFRNWQKNQKTC